MTSHRRLIRGVSTHPPFVDHVFAFLAMPTAMLRFVLNLSMYCKPTQSKQSRKRISIDDTNNLCYNKYKENFEVAYG